MFTRRSIIIAALLFAPMSPAVAQDKLPVVASFSILGDIVTNVGGDRVAVKSLVGPNGDAHVYSPSPADAKTLADAKVIFTNGLGFEGWIGRLIKSSNTKAPNVVVSKGVKSRKIAGSHGHDHGHGDGDPHAWQSVPNVKIYVANVRNGLIAADPAGKATYEANAAAYLEKLDALDREVKDAIAKIPPERRKIITTHAAFGYFEGAYGMDFIAPQGVSTDSEASARDVARIIQQIKKQKIPAVFLENISDPRLLKRIADETRVKLGGTLYSDALTDEKGDAPTYIDLIRHNIRTLSAALQS
ncbi:metal ABC transporter substrate-binding protein [Pseudorhodoplanes sinuspersici]|uniref:ABC transporter substrate-binding protein n=1 Tax=Pseudorhodoplanes sinuspersici TaxID=1235591 RepID=A0A1W6ZZY6_9HYPH|nr:metal ABC transporter substrate-binding protein [Pseudorhodoplanes sinuspersici]ARQ02934.1 ABC transporter substrate-binding protein [Pseudorhodoplanes sinuspersici]RKE70889.1 zinc/manganese transport system substrate-binding protein [Pseudorhodoplanes sinuspersici]